MVHPQSHRKKPSKISLIIPHHSVRKQPILLKTCSRYKTCSKMSKRTRNLQYHQVRRKATKVALCKETRTCNSMRRVRRIWTVTWVASTAANSYRCSHTSLLTRWWSSIIRPSGQILTRKWWLVLRIPISCCLICLCRSSQRSRLVFKLTEALSTTPLCSSSGPIASWELTCTRIRWRRSSPSCNLRSNRWGMKRHSSIVPESYQARVTLTISARTQRGCKRLQRGVRIAKDNCSSSTQTNLTHHHHQFSQVSYPSSTWESSKMSGARAICPRINFHRCQSIASIHQKLWKLYSLIKQWSPSIRAHRINGWTRFTVLICTIQLRIKSSRFCLPDASRTKVVSSLTV